MTCEVVTMYRATRRSSTPAMKNSPARRSTRAHKWIHVLGRRRAAYGGTREDPLCFVAARGEPGRGLSRLRRAPPVIDGPVIALGAARPVNRSTARVRLRSRRRARVGRPAADHAPARQPVSANHSRTVPQQGIALVGPGTSGSAATLGQTLRRAGFDVSYATEERELVELASRPALTLVVATENFPRSRPSGRLSAAAARRQASLPR